MKVAVIGATSKTGRYVVTALCDRGHDVTGIARDSARMAAIDPRARKARTDIEDATGLRAALDGAECVASLAHARHAAAVLAALPASCRRVILTGSLRKFSRLPDPAADAVRAAEAQFLASGRAGVMLHPSMIYGAPEERNVNRILSFLSRFPPWLPVPVPLPGGGRHTVQPVFVDDMVDAMVAAVERGDADGPPIAVAGPRPITYRHMVEACAAALGRTVIVVPVPLGLLAAALSIPRRIGLNAPFSADELTRATENKSFEINDMVSRLGVRPRAFEDGLAMALSRRRSAELDATGGAD